MDAHWNLRLVVVVLAAVLHLARGLVEERAVGAHDTAPSVAVV